MPRRPSRLTAPTPSRSSSPPLIARNTGINDAFHVRQGGNQRRAPNGSPPKQLKRRRHTTHDLISVANPSALPPPAQQLTTSHTLPPATPATTTAPLPQPNRRYHHRAESRTRSSPGRTRTRSLRRKRERKPRPT
jgi:hypothetical protein